MTSDESDETLVPPTRRISSKGCGELYVFSEDPNSSRSRAQQCQCPKGRCWVKEGRALHAKGLPSPNFERWRKEQGLPPRFPKAPKSRKKKGPPTSNQMDAGCVELLRWNYRSEMGSEPPHDLFSALSEKGKREVREDLKKILAAIRNAKE